jgi:hypothetical protein
MKADLRQERVRIVWTSVVDLGILLFWAVKLAFS